MLPHLRGPLLTPKFYCFQPHPTPYCPWPSQHRPPNKDSCLYATQQCYKQVMGCSSSSMWLVERGYRGSSFLLTMELQSSFQLLSFFHGQLSFYGLYGHAFLAFFFFLNELSKNVQTGGNPASSLTFLLIAVPSANGGRGIPLPLRPFPCTWETCFPTFTMTHEAQRVPLAC